MSAPKRKKIVFVCTGNTCRSPMAEVLLKARLDALGLKGFTVTSAGIQAKRGEGMNPKSVQVLAENGLSKEKFSATRLTDKLVREAFAIVCMTARQREYLMDFRWNALKKAGEEALENNVYSFAELAGYDVLDPYGRDIECYRYVFGLLSAGVDILVDKLNLPAHAYQPKSKKRPATGAKKGGAKKTKKREEI